MAKVYSGLRLTLFCRLPLLSLFVSFCLWGASLTAIMPIKAFESSWLSLDISSTGRFRKRKKGGDSFLVTFSDSKSHHKCHGKCVWEPSTGEPLIWKV